MLTCDTQIKAAYENENMSPEQIAQDQALDVVAVKAKLMQVSSKYRKDCNQDPNLNFTEDQHADVLKIIHETALSAEHPDGSVDYKTRLSAATYIRDDIKGRKEPRAMANGPVFNMLSFNESLSRARQGARSAIESLSGGRVVEQ